MRPLIVLLLSLALANPQRLVWNPNLETNLAFYNLYVYGPTNFIVSIPEPITSYPVATLPRGEYQFLLTAVNVFGLESQPAGPLLWTNLPPNVTVILYLQAGQTLGAWTNILTLTNSYSIETQAFYRAMMEIRRE